ncbi:MAG: hypothetical protein AMXMBFR33_59680 [Candidatus Xenobia bacterium]
MHIGVLFPQTEIGSDPGGLREYARAVTEAGFDHVVTYEHVLGAIPERLPRDYAPYGLKDEFHEPFTLFSFMAAVAPELSFATGILVLPQRQTALVAKQAADVFLKSGGKFRLGVGIGWNFAEFEGLGCDFASRAARMEEQVEVLRLLWNRQELDYQGRFHQLRGLGLNPRPRGPSRSGSEARRSQLSREQHCWGMASSPCERWRAAGRPPSSGCAAGASRPG